MASCGAFGLQRRGSCVAIPYIPAGSTRCRRNFLSVTGESCQSSRFHLSMDKKSTTIGVLLLIAAFGMMLYSSLQEAKRQQQLPPAPPPTETTAPAETTPAAPVESSQPQGTTALTAAEEEPATPAQTYTLRNDFIEVTFTEAGGAIERVSLVEKDGDEYKYPQTLERAEPYVVNRYGKKPLLALSLPDPLQTVSPRPEDAFAKSRYSVAQRTDESITFTKTTAQGVEIRRTYTINHEDKGPLPYEIDTLVEFRNASAADLPGPHFFLNLGAFPPTEGDIYGQYLAFGLYDGADADFYSIGKFTPSNGFLGIGANAGMPDLYEPVENGVLWGAIKNQFFTSILTTPETQGRAFYVEKIEFPGETEADLRTGLMADVEYVLPPLPAGGSRVLEGQLYVGPKEYARLDQMPYEQERVMQFGYLSGISKLLLVSLIGLHSLVGNWGLAIVALTLIIKTLLWPLTQKQVKSAKRMAKYSKPLQELREKYKDDPQKMNQKMMEFWREHRINPMAGCWPIFLQMPIFIGLFFMLRTASELRFADFLWIEDLSRSDVISWLPEIPAYIPVFGGPIHILPILMGAIMFVQMRMTPSPTTDNTQRKILQFMPVIFLVFCYNFPAGLVLYWTVQNLFTIGQQFYTNRLKDDEEELSLDLLEKRAEERRKSGNAPPAKKSFFERLEEKAKEQQKLKQQAKTGGNKGSPTQKPKRKK